MGLVQFKSCEGKFIFIAQSHKSQNVPDRANKDFLVAWFKKKTLAIKNINRHKTKLVLWKNWNVMTFVPLQNKDFECGTFTYCGFATNT